MVQQFLIVYMPIDIQFWIINHKTIHTMNLSSLIFIAITSLITNNAIAQSNVGDLAVIDFSIHSPEAVVSDDSFYTTSRQSMTHIKELISNKFTYPTSMRAYNIEGLSTVVFTLTSSGNLEDITITESLGAAFDYEIKRVLGKIKGITAIIVDGKPVSQKLVMPIQFEL